MQSEAMREPETEQEAPRDPGPGQGRQEAGPRNPFAGFWAICQKEAIHLRRDAGTVFFALLIPVLQLVLLGYAVDTNVRQLRLLVYDQALTQESRQLVERFAASDVFRVAGYAESRQAVYAAMVAGEASVGLMIPGDYSRKLLEGVPVQVQVLVDGSESSSTGMAVSAANSLLLQEALRRGANSRTSGAGNETKPLVDVRPTVLFNPGTRSPNFFVPGLVAILLQMMTILLVASSIVRERERGTMDQLLLTPMRPLGLMLGKMVPYGILAFGELAWILFLMVYFFGVPIHGSVFLLLLLIVPYLLATLGLGLLISTRARSQAEAFQMSFGTILPSIFLSGYIFSLETMPVFFQWVSRLIPARYAIAIMRGVILRGAGLEQLWEPAATLLVMAAGLIWLAARRFQKGISA